MRRKATMTVLAMTVLISISIGSGCFGSDPTTFATALSSIIPEAEEVELRIPSDPVPNGLVVGETARFYSETYTITRQVNGMVYVILSILRDVVELPPTSASESSAVWGPFTPALEPTSFRLTVEESERGGYSYVLQVRPRSSSSESDWVDIILGWAYPEGEGTGHGSFALDWSQYHEMNSNIGLLGQMEVLYDHRPFRWRSVEVIFTDLIDISEDPGATPISGSYRYLENDDTSGDFQFAFLADLNESSENLPTAELFQVRTRWIASGEGRSDVRVSGTDVSAILSEALGLEQEYLEIGECWDEVFQRTWYDETPVRLTCEDGEPDPSTWDGPGQGDESECPFEDSLFVDEDIFVM